MSSKEVEYLSFQLKQEEYGIDILCVQEIRVWSPVTELPNMPNYLRGVINLRGIIVPIVDLRLRFGYECIEYSPTTVVIVLKTEIKGSVFLVGLVVDGVSEVHKVNEEQIRKAPELGQCAGNHFISALATLENRNILLLDSRKLLDVDELFPLAQVLSKAS